jgi:hypothetical protein
MEQVVHATHRFTGTERWYTARATQVQGAELLMASYSQPACQLPSQGPMQ